MKFVKKEHIVTTVFDKDISDDNIILDIFNNLYTYAVDFSIIIEKGQDEGYSSSRLCFEKARVTQVNDDNSFNMIVFKKGYKTRMNRVKFSDVTEVIAVTRKHNIVNRNDALSRWKILDL